MPQFVKQFSVDEIKSLQDDSFLKHGVRKEEVKNPRLMGIKNDNTFHWRVPSVSDPSKKYSMYIAFPTFTTLNRLDGESAEDWVARIMRSDARVSCSCPAFTYWGYKYINTVLETEYGSQENRRPQVRNPDERGVVCKHLGRLFEKLDVKKLSSILLKRANILIEKEEAEKGKVAVDDSTDELEDIFDAQAEDDSSAVIDDIEGDLLLEESE